MLFSNEKPNNSEVEKQNNYSMNFWFVFTLRYQIKSFKNKLKFYLKGTYSDYE